MNRDLLKAELTKDEGAKLDAYQDTVGMWTIGVGHLLGTQKRMITITVEEMYALLNEDIESSIELAESIVGSAFQKLSDRRQRALVNMAFNLGPRLKGFMHFLDAVRKGNFVVAGQEMLASKWATQVGARALRLRDMIVEG